MGKILLLGLLLTTNTYASYYCENYQWNSSTKFDGSVGEVGNKGQVSYLGHNPTPSDNIGSYEFRTTKDSFVMEFVGEPRHICTRDVGFDWNCKMGRWFRYSLTCEF